MGERIKLIIGHVTPTSAKVWVQGAAEAQARVTITDPSGNERAQTLSLTSAKRLIDVADFPDLNADCLYKVQATFGPGDVASGRFRTFPEQNQPFSFLLVSCNKNLGDPTCQQIQALYGQSDLKFIMHCGDQIYYDHEDDEANPPSLKMYRKRYNETWGDDPHMRHMLGHFPNYMILDDHEIANDFSVDDPAEMSGSYPVSDYLAHGVPAYERFQHCHNPPSPVAGKYFYTFDCAGAHFFVLDLRLDRRPVLAGAPEGAMISDQQMQELFRWLVKYKKQPKFVVTSMPFVGIVTGLLRAFVERKWNSPDYRGQRDEIMSFLGEKAIKRLVFLTGDLHASYHATLRVRSGGEDFLVHELMASPINHGLRPLWGLGLRNSRKTWKPGEGVKVTSDIGDIHAKRSVMKITVDPSAARLQYEIRHLKQGKPLGAGNFSLD